MRRSALFLTAACTVVAVPASADAGDDVLVWGTSAGGYETKWIHVDGGEAQVVARRPEAVASDGRRLWALRFSTKHIDMLPCSALEDEDGGDKAKPEGSADLPALHAVLLGSGRSAPIIEASTATGGYGEVWGNTIELRGGSGARVAIHRTDSGFGCGAHGFAEGGLSVWDLAKGERLPDAGAGAFAALQAKATPGIVKEAAQNDCVEDGDDPTGHVVYGGVSVVRSGGGVQGKYSFVLPSESESNFACETEGTVEGPLLPATGLAAPDGIVDRALAAAGFDGTVGYARLSLDGDARAAALAAFSAASKAPAGGASASEQIEAGRKATKAKDYKAAVAAFDAAIAGDAKAARAWSGRGYARLLGGELDAARTDLERALTLESDAGFQAAVWFNLGLVAEKKGDAAAARAAYGKANTLKPSKAAQGKLESLR